MEQIVILGAQAPGLAAAILAASGNGGDVLLTAQGGGAMYVAGVDQSINVSPTGEQTPEDFG